MLGYILRNCSMRRPQLVRRVYYTTIFNLSSGFGKCGVAVIRVSGQQTMEALMRIVSSQFRPKNRVAHLKMLYHPVTNELIDKGIVIWFPGPKSFTGEDCCEFQVHGSFAVIKAMMDALANVPGLRISRNGEFTKRAFLNGKLDLTEVDGLADLIHAETEAQRKQAVLQNTGSLSILYKDWRTRLISNVANLEAFIDFADDEQIGKELIEKTRNNILGIHQEISNHLNDKRQGEILRNGIRTAIIGLPNVGKSSCLNVICKKQVSIVTSIAGTTRDIVESFYDICGYPVLFSDTAGLRDTPTDVIEKEGIRLAKECLNTSDLILIIMDAAIILRTKNISKDSFEKFKQEYLLQLGLSPKMIEDKHVLYIINKIDLISNEEIRILRGLDVVLMSCLDGTISELLGKLEQKLRSICSVPMAGNPCLTQVRYRHLLSNCNSYIEQFLTLHEKCLDLAIVSQALRKAINCIGNITGEVRNDEILDVVFKDFCIGK